MDQKVDLWLKIQISSSLNPSENVKKFPWIIPEIQASGEWDKQPKNNPLPPPPPLQLNILSFKPLFFISNQSHTLHASPTSEGQWDDTHTHSMMIDCNGRNKPVQRHTHIHHIHIHQTTGSWDVWLASCLTYAVEETPYLCQSPIPFSPLPTNTIILDTHTHPPFTIMNNEINITGKCPSAFA